MFKSAFWQRFFGSFYWGGQGAGVIVPGPYCVHVVQCYVPGGVVSQGYAPGYAAFAAYSAGPALADSYSPGVAAMDENPAADGYSAGQQAAEGGCQ